MAPVKNVFSLPNLIVTIDSSKSVLHLGCSSNFSKSPLGLLTSKHALV